MWRGLAGRMGQGRVLWFLPQLSTFQDSFQGPQGGIQGSTTLMGKTRELPFSLCKMCSLCDKWRQQSREASHAVQKVWGPSLGLAVEGIIKQQHAINTVSHTLKSCFDNYFTFLVSFVVLCGFSHAFKNVILSKWTSQVSTANQTATGASPMKW